MITKLGIHYDPNRLWAACLPLIETYGWGSVGQICLTYRPEVTDPTERIFDGAGTSSRNERDFSLLNAACQDTYIEQVLTTLPFKVGRLRIMRMRGRTCYSVHKDHTMRVHLPLITNPQALMIFPDDAIIAHLIPGQVYLTDTTQRHSAMNGGLDERYHLVGALCA